MRGNNGKTPMRRGSDDRIDGYRWIERKLQRGMLLGVVWLLAGVVALIARLVHNGIVERRARRLAKGGPGKLGGGT